MLKTGMNFDRFFGADIDDETTLRMIRDAGFDTIFTGWNESDGGKFNAFIAEKAANLGLIYESLHAPFSGINCIWSEGIAGEEYAARLKRCVDTAQSLGVGYVTVHVAIASTYNREPTRYWSETGQKRFSELAEHAEKSGLKIAFENVEFPQGELKIVIDKLREASAKGFGVCWDVGHEHCYRAERFRVPEVFGDLVIGTHMHDNFGISDPSVVTWKDDVHVMPFDGTNDYRRIGKELKKIGYTGSVNLEIARTSRQWDILPWYRDFTPEEFFAEAYKKASRIAMLCEM